jgi:hypothetical protein
MDRIQRLIRCEYVGVIDMEHVGVIELPVLSLPGEHGSGVDIALIAS